MHEFTNTIKIDVLMHFTMITEVYLKWHVCHKYQKLIGKI
jgi:hypothetical protein